MGRSSNLFQGVPVPAPGPALDGQPALLPHFPEPEQAKGVLLRPVLR